jgi:hypothetical protein
MPILDTLRQINCQVLSAVKEFTRALAHGFCTPLFLPERGLSV